MMMIIIIIVSRKQQSDAETGSIILNNMSKQHATLSARPILAQKQYIKRHDRLCSTPLQYMQGNKDKIRKGTLISACTKIGKNKQ